MSRTTTLAAGLAAAAALALPASASAADAIYGVTDQNRLIRFNSDGPGQTTGNVPISGLASGESVVGIDVRPANDTLYAVTSASRAVQVNPITGATRPAYGPFSPTLSGTSFGVDFNPQADALRIVSDAEQNLRVVSPAVTVADAPLNYPAGDPGAGSNPSVGSAAYANNTPGASSTTLYGIDTARDTLVRIDPPNAGTLRTVGALGVNAGEPVGFDIAPTGNTAYATMPVEGQETRSLYRVDLGSGSATAVSTRAVINVPAGAGALRGIAVAGQVADDNTRPEMSVAFSSTILEQNTNTLEPSISCNESCTVTVEAQVQGRDAGQATETIVGAGRETVEVRLSSTARARIRRSGTELISLDIAAIDAAGNRTTQNNRVSRTQTLAARRSG
jgi:Domain of unknown function (DUF4394)